MNIEAPYKTATAVPKYCQIKSMIINMIKSGKLKENMKVFSESTLSREFGVNRNTVAKALNELALEGYILRKQGMGSFVAPQTSKKRTGNIGVLVQNIEDKFYSLIAKYAESAAKDNGYHVILCNTGSFNLEKEAIETLVTNEKVDGLIIVPADLTSPQEQEFFGSLKKQKIPFVFLFPQVLLENFNLVAPNYSQGAYEAVELLMNSGKKKIACVVTKDRHYYGIAQRIEGCKRAAASHNIDLSIIEVADANENEGYKLSRNIAQMGDMPDGIIAVNDATAIGLLQGLREKGINVPEDIAIIGFDDIEYSSDSNIQLTTMRYNYSRMCNIAIHSILKQYDSSGTAPIKMEIPIEAVIRKTCKPDNHIV